MKLTNEELKNYLKQTEILNYDSKAIKSLVIKRGWKTLSPFNQIGEIYNFVKDEIKFGYNLKDDISASDVLKDGYGQCNTKANLFMALLRAVGVPNRIHGFTIDKSLQKGAIRGLWFKLSPQNILHSWVEVFLNEKWYNLEGLILDDNYLKSLQKKFKNCTTTFCGYGAYTDNFQNPKVNWKLNDTYIQKKGINQDFGLFDTPDDFYELHQQKLSPLKKWVYQKVVRHLMNYNVSKIRNGNYS